MIRKVILGALVAVVLGLATQTASAAPAIVREPSTARVYHTPYGPRLYPVYSGHHWAPHSFWRAPRHWRR
jgi:hypothetical protein